MSICWSNNKMMNRKGVSGSRLLRDLLELIWWKVLLGMNELKWMNLNDCFFYFFFLLLILAFLFAFFFCSRLLLLSFFIRLIVLCDYLKSQSNELDWTCLSKYWFISFSARHLIIPRYSQMSSRVANDSGCNELQGLLTFYEPEPFSCSS